MGDEYIKRSDVLIKLEIAYDMARLDQKLPISDLQHEVNLIKAADVQPVKHGRWIAENRDVRGYADCYTCSNCNNYTYMYTLMKDCEHEYCPNCGARMDAEPDEPRQSE